jgi:hypothetical protein
MKSVIAGTVVAAATTAILLVATTVSTIFKSAARGAIRCGFF